MAYVDLDPLDVRLLALLQEDGRRSFAELGAALGMSGPSAHERVRKLEARGVIRGYAADVDPAAVGRAVVAFTWVTQAPGTVATDLAPAFAAIPEVEECHHVAGEADYGLKIRARDTGHLGEVVQRIQTTEHVFTTETDVAFRTCFERRPLVLDAEHAGRRARGGPRGAGEAGRRSWVGAAFPPDQPAGSRGAGASSAGSMRRSGGGKPR